MPDQNQQLDDFLKSTKSGSGFFKFGEGKTGLFPLFETGQNPIAAFAKTMQYYNGEPTDRWVVYCLLALAEDKDSLPDGYEGKLIPVSVPKTIAHGLAKKLISDDFTDAAQFTELSENGMLIYGNMFVVERMTDGKQTKYEVTVASKIPDDLTKQVQVPELSIQGYAQNDSDRAEQRNKEYIEEQAQKAGPGTVNPLEQNDFAGFA